MIDKKLLAILVCPLCKGQLTFKTHEPALWCRFDRLAYPIRDGIPIMLESEAKKLTLEDLDKYEHS